MINRRKLIVALGAGALAAPFGSLAQQQGKVWRVGFLASRGRPVSLDADVFGGFPRGMRELGYVEDKNLVIEWRFGENRAELLPGLAADLVRLKVDAIIAVSSHCVRAAQKATTTIPIVMVNTADPVGSGFIASLARPGGNITGLTNLSGETSVKHLEMLRAMVPKLVRVGVLVNPTAEAQAATVKSIQTEAARAGVKVLLVEARTSQDIENAFSTMAREKAGGVVVLNNPLFDQQQRQIVGLATKNRLPSIFGKREFVEIGALMSYGTNLADDYRRVVAYVDKILKGAKPADLPVEQPTTFEVFINGKTAKALGLKIPNSLLVMADKVIE